MRLQPTEPHQPGPKAIPPPSNGYIAMTGLDKRGLTHRVSSLPGVEMSSDATKHLGCTCAQNRGCVRKEKGRRMVCWLYHPPPKESPGVHWLNTLVCSVCFCEEKGVRGCFQSSHDSLLTCIRDSSHLLGLTRVSTNQPFYSPECYTCLLPAATSFIYIYICIYIYIYIDYAITVVPFPPLHSTPSCPPPPSHIPPL